MYVIIDQNKAKMKQIFLFVVLALGMCSICIMAQQKKLQTASNGYQWYKISDGKGHVGVESKNGNVLIPTNRGYNNIYFSPKKNTPGVFCVERDKKEGVCDFTGKEIFAPEKYEKVMFSEVDGHMGFYYVGINDVWGICDIYGGEIIPCKYKSIAYCVVGNFDVQLFSGEWKSLDVKLDSLGRAYGSDVVKSTAIFNAKTETTPTQKQEKDQKIIIEHHRDPVPVQEWQQCTNCGGAGKLGCTGCGGSGTIYIGDNLRKCHYCNGHGENRCTFCSGNGGKYITVYR